MMLQQIISYFQANTAFFIQRTGEHITISLIALAVAVILGVSAGYICVRYEKLQDFIVPLFQTLRIVPSLAVLFLLIPFIGVGIFPAMIALVLLAIPPILINTAAGLREVPAFMLETAVGCGMTERQVWYKVRLPLAMPMVFSGVQTALVEIIASATLAAKIGAGGLGEIIFTGLSLNRTDLLLIGGLSVAILSISARLVLGLLHRLILPYKH